MQTTLIISVNEMAQQSMWMSSCFKHSEMNISFPSTQDNAKSVEAYTDEYTDKYWLNLIVSKNDDTECYKK